MVARSGRIVEEMTFWYNATKGERIVSPYEMMFVAKSRMPGVTEKRQEIRRIQPDANVSSVVGNTLFNVELNPFVPGDKVFLRQNARCDKPWSGPHRVTAIKSSVSVALDDTDIPRHISHLRRVPEKKAGNDLAEMVVDFDEAPDDLAEMVVDFDEAPAPDENISEIVEEATEVEENVENISIPRYPKRFGMTEKIEPAYKN